MTGEIIFDKPKVRQLKRAYASALADGETEFSFEGHPLLIAYAKYLIEYLETKVR